MPVEQPEGRGDGGSILVVVDKTKLYSDVQ